MSSIRTCIYYSRKKKVERGKNRNKIIKIKLCKLDMDAQSAMISIKILS